MPLLDARNDPRYDQVLMQQGKSIGLSLKTIMQKRKLEQVEAEKTALNSFITSTMLDNSLSDRERMLKLRSKEGMEKHYPQVYESSTKQALARRSLTGRSLEGQADLAKLQRGLKETYRYNSATQEYEIIPGMEELEEHYRRSIQNAISSQQTPLPEVAGKMTSWLDTGLEKPQVAPTPKAPAAGPTKRMSFREAATRRNETIEDILQWGGKRPGTKLPFDAGYEGAERPGTRLPFDAGYEGAERPGTVLPTDEGYSGAERPGTTLPFDAGYETTSGKPAKRGTKPLRDDPIVPAKDYKRWAAKLGLAVRPKRSATGQRTKKVTIQGIDKPGELRVSDFTRAYTDKQKDMLKRQSDPLNAQRATDVANQVYGERDVSGQSYSRNELEQIRADLQIERDADDLTRDLAASLPRATKALPKQGKRSWSKTFKPTSDELAIANSLLQYEDDSMKVRSYLEGYRKANAEEKATIQQILQENIPANIKKLLKLLATM